LLGRLDAHRPEITVRVASRVDNGPTRLLDRGGLIIDVDSEFLARGEHVLGRNLNILVLYFVD